MKVLGSTVCSYMCWAKGKYFVRKYCDLAASQCLNLYMKIRAVLVLRSNAGGARGAVRGAKGCTRRYQSWCDRLETPKDWMAEHYCWGLRALCVLLRLHSMWQRETTKKHRRRIASEAQYKRGTQLGASKEQDMVRTETRRSVREVRQKTASAEHSSTVFPPKNIPRSWRTQSRGQAKRS